MNKTNLIKLGAFCQDTFDLEDNFKVLFDNGNTPCVALPIYSERLPSYMPYTFIDEKDIVELTKIGIKDSEYEFARVGYSRKANTLVVRLDE